MPRILHGLWREPDFVRLWWAHSISLFGTQISHLAIPLTAALVLDASAWQMGVLAALEFTPFLLLSLFAGVWADRAQRRPILIVGDLGRAILLASIPTAAVLGVLRIELLYVVGFLVGVLTVFFDVANQSFLPVLVKREQLVEGNSKLELSRSIAQITGPGIAGVLVQAFTAPLAVALDALSFLLSMVFLLLIRTPEPSRPPQSSRPAVIWREVREGLAVVVGNPLLRSIAGCTATSNLFSNAMLAVYVLYATRVLGLEPAVLGIILASAGPAALLGALLAGRLANRLGLGTTIIGAILLSTLANLLVPLATGAREVVVGMLMLAAALTAFGGTVYNINQVSLRQAITPDRLLGRMNASMRFIVWGTIPVGALLGGVLGDALGLQPTLVAMACAGLLAPLWVILSPIRHLRQQPAPSEPALAA